MLLLYWTPQVSSLYTEHYIQEKQLAEEYDSKYVIWQEKLKILEENPKRQKDLLQCRKYFETMFPTIKRKLEQEDRFNR